MTGAGAVPLKSAQRTGQQKPATKKKNSSKLEQIWGDVLTYTTKHKEQFNTSAFDRVFVRCKRRDRT